MSMPETMSQPDFRKPNCLVVGLRSSQTKMLYLSYNTILLIQGDAVYLATVYFINKDLICSSGRSQDEFEDQGTGNVLWLQKRDGTFLKAPLEMDAADEGVRIYYTLFKNQYLGDILMHNMYLHFNCLEVLEVVLDHNYVPKTRVRVLY